MVIIRKICLLFRKLYSRFATEQPKQTLLYDKSGQSASDYIKDLLEGDNPVMIARFGSVELTCLVDYINKPTIRNCIRFIAHRSDSLGYSKSTRYTMGNNAGFFPVTTKNLNIFSELMLKAMPLVDVLGSWQQNEKLFERELVNAVIVPLDNLEPYFQQNPWSEVLKGKKVLIIHPFEDSIREQYAKRSLLFEDNRVLPEFDLQTIKAVQSIASNACEFDTWFFALESMKKEIDKRDFDIAIIGCGAYGFPLAAYVKSIGKKAVHLGGATQMLFGIKSKAWEEQPQFKRFINRYWAKPKDSERPVNFSKVENGRYW